MFTAKQFECALVQTLDSVRRDVVQAWTMADSPEKREELWHEQKAIERIEEKVRNDFESIIERAADGQ